MARVSYLMRRNGIYWFKVDVPDQLAGQRLPPSFPEALRHLESHTRRGHLKTAIWLSLRNTAEREARQRVGLEIARHARLFEAAATFLTHGHMPSADSCLSPGGDAITSAWPTGVANFKAAKPAQSSLPVVPVEPVQGGGVINADRWTMTQAFRAWSAGGGLKGVKTPPATRSSRPMQHVGGSLSYSAISRSIKSARGMAEPIGTRLQSCLKACQRH